MLLWCLTLFGAAAAHAADDPPPSEKKAEGANNSDASANNSAEKEAAAELQRIIGRLPPRDREAVERKNETGRIPAEAEEQRIVGVVDSSYIGHDFYGGNGQPRFYVARLTLFNLTNEAVVVWRDSIRLDFDGTEYPLKQLNPNLANRPIQVGKKIVQLRSLTSPAELAVPSGEKAETWLVISDLPPGNQNPAMLLKYKIGEKQYQYDVIAGERDSLKLSLERIGPRKSLGILRIAGVLNTINIGSLLESLDRLATDRVVRVVIDFTPEARVAELPVLHWLQNSAMSAGRLPQFNDQQFPEIPRSFREFHLSRLPNPSTSDNVSSYPSNFVPTTGEQMALRIHSTEGAAVIAALRSAYEALPREEVLQAIQTGSSAERAAALTGGGGKIPADKLPILTKLADSDEQLIQTASIRALANFGEREAIEKLVKCAERGPEAATQAALSGLAGSRFESAHQALLALLDRGMLSLKKQIIQVMAENPRPLFADAIFKFVTESQGDLNVAAIKALEQIGHPNAVRVMIAALQNGPPDLRKQVFGLLAARTDRESEIAAVEYALDYLKNSPPDAAMLDFLVRVKEPRAVPLLTAKFDEIKDRNGLVKTLIQIGDEQTAKFLTGRYAKLQNDEQVDVLKMLRRSDPAGFRQFAVQALADGDASTAMEAANGLVEDGSVEAVGVLTEAFEKSKRPFVWQYAVNGLATLATSDCRAALKKVRDSADEAKRVYAVQGLSAIRMRSQGYGFYQRGYVLSNLEKHKEAIVLFNSALKLDPDLSDAYASRAHCYLSLEKLKEAEQDFLKAYELDPYNSMALTGVCLSLIMVDGKVDDAIKKLETDRSKFQNQYIFHYNAACVYGRAYERLHNDKDAVDREKRMREIQKAGFVDLKKSIDGGFDDHELLKKDPDLRLFRELPEFPELLKNVPDAPKQANGAQRQRGR